MNRITLPSMLFFLADQNGKEFWVGARDVVAEGVFYWQGGPDVVLNTLFQNGEPDNGALLALEEDCLLLAADMKLSDRACLSSNFFICEAPASSQRKK